MDTHAPSEPQEKAMFAKAVELPEVRRAPKDTTV